MTTFPKIISSLFGMFLFFGASSAYAQFNVQDCNSGVTGCSVILSSTSSSSTALAGGLIFTAVLGVDQATTMRKFLRENQVALAAEISMGSGASLRDFAHLLGVKEGKFINFSKILRHRRSAFAHRMKFAIKNQEGAEAFIIWIAEFAT